MKKTWLKLGTSILVVAFVGVGCASTVESDDPDEGEGEAVESSESAASAKDPYRLLPDPKIFDGIALSLNASSNVLSASRQSTHDDCTVHMTFNHDLDGALLKVKAAFSGRSCDKGAIRPTGVNFNASEEPLNVNPAWSTIAAGKSKEITLNGNTADVGTGSEVHICSKKTKTCLAVVNVLAAGILLELAAPSKKGRRFKCKGIKCVVVSNDPLNKSCRGQGVVKWDPSRGQTYVQDDRVEGDEMFDRVNACYSARDRLLQEIKLPPHCQIGACDCDIKKTSERSYILGQKCKRTDL